MYSTRRVNIFNNKIRNWLSLTFFEIPKYVKYTTTAALPLCIYVYMCVCVYVCMYVCTIPGVTFGIEIWPGFVCAFTRGSSVCRYICVFVCMYVRRLYWRRSLYFLLAIYIYKMQHSLHFSPQIQPPSTFFYTPTHSVTVHDCSWSTGWGHHLALLIMWLV